MRKQTRRLERDTLESRTKRETNGNGSVGARRYGGTTLSIQYT